AGVLVLTAFERRGRETVEARIGVTYAIAAPLTILSLAVDPHGDAEMVNLLKGDILATTRTSLTLLAGVLGAVVLVLFACRKEFLLVSFDRDLAVVFGKWAGLWDGLLYLTIGVTISLGVMTAGPLVTFGFLVVPPLTARLLTRRMLSFSLVAAAIGGAGAFGGLCWPFRRRVTARSAQWAARPARALRPPRARRCGRRALVGRGLPGAVRRRRAGGARDGRARGAGRRRGARPPSGDALPRRDAPRPRPRARGVQRRQAGRAALCPQHARWCRRHRGHGIRPAGTDRRHGELP